MVALLPTVSPATADPVERPQPVALNYRATGCVDGGSAAYGGKSLSSDRPQHSAQDGSRTVAINGLQRREGDLAEKMATTEVAPRTSFIPFVQFVVLRR